MEIKNITFSVREENNKSWSVYMETDEREVLCGNFPSEWMAQKAAKEAQKRFDSVPAKTAHEHKNFKLTLPTKQAMQAVAMGLDPMRAAKFREQLICMNYCVHMLTDAFDQISFFFDAIVDKSVKAHYSIASKHIEALLDAVMKSQIAGGTMQEYADVAGAAYALKERLELVTSYVQKDDWRLHELEKTLDNVIPEEWLHSERLRIGAEIRAMLDANTHGERCEIVEKGGKA